jgi:hypothetical protein
MPAVCSAAVGVAVGVRSTFLLVLMATVLMGPSLLLGRIQGDNSFLNAVWSEGFARLLFAGDFYPRWLPDMGFGTGSPVFYFYAPLPFWLIAPFHLVAGPEMAATLGSWLMLTLSGLAFFMLSRAFVGVVPALFAAMLYMAMPYHFLVDTLVRASLGEQAAFVFMPLSLMAAHRLPEGRQWTLALAASYAGLLMSHLPSSLLFAPFLSGYCLWRAWRSDPQIVLTRAVMAAGLSFGLAAAYVLPAMTLQRLIHSEMWSVVRPQDNFLLGSHTSALATFLTPIVLGLAIVSLSCVTIAMWAGEARVWPWVMILLGTLFVMTPVSAWAWQALPLVERIQFPTRALSLFELAVCMTVALALETRGFGWALPLGAVGIGVTLAVAMIATGPDSVFAARTLTELDEFVAARADAMEYLPACRPYRAADELGGISSIRVTEKSLHEAKGRKDVIPVFYYPFLTLTVDSEERPTGCDPETGFLTAEIPPGAHVRVAKSTLPVERMGQLCSLASLAFLLFGLVWPTRARSGGQDRGK